MGDFMARLAPWLALIAGLACAAGGAALAWHFKGQADAARDAAHDADTAWLIANDYTVAAQVEADIARQDAAKLFAESRTLLARIEQLERRGARVETVIQVVTDPLDLPPNSPPCLVASSDKMQLRVNAVSLETVAQNTVLVAEAEAWRLRPDTPDLLLARGELRGRYETVPPPVDNRWPWWAHELIGLGIGLVAGRLLP